MVGKSLTEKLPTRVAIAKRLQSDDDNPSIETEIHNLYFRLTGRVIDTRISRDAIYNRFVKPLFRKRNPLGMYTFPIKRDGVKDKNVTA